MLLPLFLLSYLPQNMMCWIIVMAESIWSYNYLMMDSYMPRLRNELGLCMPY